MKQSNKVLSNDWGTESVIDPEKEYQSLLSSIRRKQGFGFIFVRCSPAEGEELMGRILEDIPRFSVELLSLDFPVHDFCRFVNDLPLISTIDVLFVTGIETFLIDTSAKGGNETENLESVPRSLSHLSLQLEQLHQNFPNIRFIFLLPLYALKFFIQQIPDLMDWQSEVFEFPTDIELQQEDTLRTLLETNYQRYLLLSNEARQQKLEEFQALLDSGHLDLETKVEMLLEQGGLLALGGNYNRALANCNLAVALNPEFYIAWYNRGFAQSILGLHEEAIASYERVLSLKSDFYPALYNCGIALSILGRYEEAIACYKQAVNFKPDYHYALLAIASAQADLRHYAEAIETYDRALAIQPQDAYAWYSRGFALSNLSRHEEAIASYDKALAIKPNSAEIWYSRARSLVALKLHAEAIASFEKSLDIKPYDHYGWNNRGLALSDLGRYDEALVSFDQALLIKPDDHYAWYCRGNALSELGRFEEAIASYDKAIEIEPDKQKFWENRQLALRRVEFI